ncbi:hypothetical protein FG386_003252 [Cryptosporidium ryanae]|uniref:uncharacterized protein n=1 Tax=Cryptosporidium ryanae TaxID=515981 RepID=UPI003519F8BF|nr:hypothetical protein FG386_003252 [Cryptosporidium ryanae]
MTQNLIKITNDLLKACEAGELSPVTIMNVLKNIDKVISGIKKETMEITPIDILISSDNYFDSEDTNSKINSNYSESVLKLREYVRFYLKISSIIMGTISNRNDELQGNKVLMSCLNSNREKLRTYVIQSFFKWLRDDVLIREYRNIKEKGNFNNVLNFPVSVSTYIIRCILLSSIKKSELKRIILDNKMCVSNQAFTIEDLLLSKYINRFKDLRCFFLKHIYNLIQKCISGNINNLFHTELDIEDDDSVEILDKTTTISLRTYYILIKLDVPKIVEEPQDNKTIRNDLLFASNMVEDEKYTNKIKKFEKDYRLIYQKLWLSFVKFILNKNNSINQTVSVQILKNTLEYVSETVIPIISNPLELADIFKSCYDGVYNSGDRIDDMDKLSLSVVSLSGLFYLITNNRLNESSFIESNDNENISTGYYRRLYEIISPPIFFLKTRGKLFSLISISLMSPLIPMTVLCCFIKKLIRISVFTATNDTVWLISLVNTLVNKHRNVLFPILSLNENDKDYNFVSDILNEVNGELWSYGSDINSYITKNINLQSNRKNNEDDSIVTVSKNDEFKKNMGAYISANFGLWELYLLNKSVVPVIRIVSNALTLKASNANVNHHMHNLDNEDLVGLSSEDVLKHEISSQNGIISTYSSSIKKNKRECENSSAIIPHNYMQDIDLSSFSISKSSEKFFTSSDSELLALI